MAGGFKMGPFELMDLVGVDVGFEISRSFYDQSFGEPRWRPSMIAARTVAAGHHGRKSGRGYYEYPESGDYRPADPDALPVGGGEGVIVIAGETPLALELAELAGEAGWEVADPADAGELAAPFLILDLSDGEGAEAPLQGGPQAICCAAGSLAALDPAGGAVGFHALPPLRDAHAGRAHPRAGQRGLGRRRRRERFFATLGKHTTWVGDAPGLVLGRIVCQVINEAAFALGEGVGSAAGHRRRHGPRARLPARDPRLGRRDRPRPRPDRARRPATRSTARSATGPRRPCAGSPWSGRLGVQTGERVLRPRGGRP